MKFKTSILILAGLFLGLSFAFSQEDEFVLHHEEIGRHQRPLVRLNHERHSEIIDCTRCHHNYDENGNNTAEDGQSCSGCHGKVGSTEIPFPLWRPSTFNVRAAMRDGYQGGKQADRLCVANATRCRERFNGTFWSVVRQAFQEDCIPRAHPLYSFWTNPFSNHKIKSRLKTYTL